MTETVNEQLGDHIDNYNKYKTDNDSRVKAVEDKNASQDTAISAAQTTANEAKSAASTNSADITALETNLTNLDSTVAGHTTRISAIETDISTNVKQDISSLEGTVGTLSETVNTNKTNITKNTSDISALTTRVSTTESDISTLKTDVSDIETSLGGYVKSTDYNTKVSAIEESISDEVSRADSAEKAIDAKVNTLIGDDTDKSARDIAKEVVASQIADAPESFDTLLEIANYLETHSDDAVTMQNDITSNKNKLAGIDTTVVAHVDAKIAESKTVATNTAIGLVKSSADENTVAVAADGVMSVNSINIDKLVQTNGSTLILRGGTASS